jgi:hypothetical protein
MIAANQATLEFENDSGEWDWIGSVVSYEPVYGDMGA